jgi:hypothetical protein
MSELHPIREDAGTLVMALSHVPLLDHSVNALLIRHSAPQGSNVEGERK